MTQQADPSHVAMRGAARRRVVLAILVVRPAVGRGDVDYLPIDVAASFLLEAFDRSLVTEGVPIAPIEAVVLTKLIRLAMRDQADVVELLKAGLFEAAAVERYLDANAPMLTERFRALIEQATREREREG